MENIDYDYNYDDESHDYTDDYQALGLAIQASNLPQGSKPSNTSDHDLDEILVALRKMEVKRSRDLEKCLRDKIKSIERDKLAKEKKDEKHKMMDGDDKQEVEEKEMKKGININEENKDEKMFSDEITTIKKLNLSDLKLSAEIKQKRSILGAEDIDNYRSDHEPIYEIPRELSPNNQFNQTKRQKNRLNLDLIDKSDTKDKNDST